MVKTALAFAFTKGINPSKCKVALKTLLSETDDSAYAIYYLLDVVTDRIENELCHIISLNGSKERKTLFAYIEYFHYLRIVVNLSDEYDGDNILHTYAINPRTGNEITQSVHWEALNHSITTALSGYVDDFVLDRACSEAIDIASHYRILRERHYRFQKQFDATLLEMGLELGSIPPESRSEEFNRLMTEKLGDFSKIDSGIKSFDDINKK
ncbi:hypothetical protein D3C71_1189410 [compost metagenome]